MPTSSASSWTRRPSPPPPATDPFWTSEFFDFGVDPYEKSDPNSPYFQNKPGPYVNQTATPVGGSSSTCPWSVNNCGPNDEPFSSHNGGCYVGFVDGHVTFLKNDVPGDVLRYLCIPDDGRSIDPQYIR